MTSVCITNETVAQIIYYFYNVQLFSDKDFREQKAGNLVQSLDYMGPE